MKQRYEVGYIIENDEHPLRIGPWEDGSDLWMSLGSDKKDFVAMYPTRKAAKIAADNLRRVANKRNLKWVKSLHIIKVCLIK